MATACFPKWPRASPGALLCDPGHWASSPCYPVRLRGLPHHPLPVAGHSLWLQLAMHVVLERPPGAAEWACRGGGACPVPPGASQKSRKLRAWAEPPGPCTQPPSCSRIWALCLVLPGEPDPPCPRVGCSRGGQRAPHWEQTSHPRPLHAHSLFGTPAAPGPPDQSTGHLAGCAASCI